MKMLQLTSPRGNRFFLSPLVIADVWERLDGEPGSTIYIKGGEESLSVREDAATVATLFGDATE